jgi:hypothetical protein
LRVNLAYYLFNGVVGQPGNDDAGALLGEFFTDGFPNAGTPTRDDGYFAI